MQFRLVVERKGRAIRSIEIESSVASVGRAAHGNDVRIPSSEVSRKHCEFSEKDGLISLQDLDSINGTYLNDNLIAGVAVVRPGDHVEIGPVTFVVEYELTPQALERLRSMDYELVVAEDDDAVVLELAEDEDDTEVVRKVKPRPKRGEKENEEEEDLQDPFASMVDLDDVSWKPPEKGDLHDMLSGLDGGDESAQPRKRPLPRKKVEDDEETPEPAPTKEPKRKGKKPKAED